MKPCTTANPLPNHMKKKTETPDASARPPLPYLNPAFLNSPDGRVIRILSEYSEPLARFRRERIQDTVVFFGSARFGPLDLANETLEGLGNLQPTGVEEDGSAVALRRSAEAAVEMAQYYEDARRLAYMLTAWSQTIKSRRHRFVVTSGGGPGIMEAANRGAHEAGGKTIGLNIRLPLEQTPNPYITPALNFDFHYFFMRKYWFAYLAKALVVFPGGFGTMDELFELLTLTQTQKLAKHIVILVYGTSYWKSILNLDALVDKGAISPEDRGLFRMADTPEQAFEMLKEDLSRFYLEPETKSQPHASAEEESLLNPEIARTR